MAYLKYTVNNHQGVYDIRVFSVQESYVPNNRKNGNRASVALKEKKQFLSFMGKTKQITHELKMRYGMNCDFAGNPFLAECVQKISNVFDNLFGRSSLPRSVTCEPLFYGILGTFYHQNKSISFNSNSSCFDNMEKLKEESESAYHFLLPNEFSSLHPACTFVHEFSHSAHYDNLAKHWGDACSIMEELRHTQVPTVIGRLITRFKLGNYALDQDGGMNEFMAERMTQDICKGLTYNSWLYVNNRDNVKYSDIFERKWDCRYSSPQSYLDYYTQQVWNGDIREAENAAGKIERYLAELDAERVPKAVSTPVSQIHAAGIPILDKIANGVSSFFENLTEKLDNRNRLTMK